MAEWVMDDEDEMVWQAAADKCGLPMEVAQLVGMLLASGRIQSEERDIQFLGELFGMRPTRRRPPNPHH